MSSESDFVVTTHHELGLLPRLVSLPRDPIAAKWETTERKHGQASMLRALLRFEAEDWAHIVEASETFDRRGNEILQADEWDVWVDAAAKDGIEVVRTDAGCELLGVEPRRANLFARAARSPYVNGKITPLANGFVLLSMYAM